MFRISCFGFRIYFIKSMFQKFFFARCSLFLVLFSLFSVSPVLAAEIPPQQNPLCWAKANCEAQIKANGWDFNGQLNFLPGGSDGECGSWGGCIPAGQTQLSITVGDQAGPIANLGDYIKKIYLYLVGIGGLIATVLIIKGGFEWTTSAGNPTRLTSAKSSITGALMGLFLLLGSYTLLYTINPDLLRLKLPRVFMVRALTLGTEWCKDLSNPMAQKFALAQLSSSETPKEFKDVKLDDFTIAFPAQQSSAQEDYLTEIEGGQSNPETAMPCGAKYYSLDGQDQTCMAHFCSKTQDGKPQTCVKKEGDKHECTLSVLSGIIRGTAGGSLMFPWIDNNVELRGFCTSAKWTWQSEVVDAVEDKEKQTETYAFVYNLESRIPSGHYDCLKDPAISGWFLVAEINDKSGSDDLYAIGRSGGICNTNILTKVGWMGKGWDDSPELQALLVSNFSNIKQYMFTLEELKAGLVCDINLTRTEFPAL